MAKWVLARAAFKNSGLRVVLLSTLTLASAIGMMALVTTVSATYMMGEILKALPIEWAVSHWQALSWLS